MFSQIELQGESTNSNYANQLDIASFFRGQTSSVPSPPGALRGWPVTVSVEGIGFSYQLTNDDLYKVFSRYGTVAHVDVMMPEGNAATVFFSTYDEASRAIASLDGKELAGVKGHLRVAWGPLPTSLSFGANISNELRGPHEPVRKYTCRFEIGIENDKDFQVARRIIGQKGINMKNIVSRTDAKLRLRGRGSGYLEGMIRQESPEPLHLCVSCTTKRGYTDAARLVAELLERVYDDYRHFCSLTGAPYPAHLKLTIREHPLGSGPYPPIDEYGSNEENEIPNRSFGNAHGGFKHFSNPQSSASTNATTSPVVSAVFPIA